MCNGRIIAANPICHVPRHSRRTRAISRALRAVVKFYPNCLAYLVRELHRWAAVASRSDIAEPFLSERHQCENNFCVWQRDSL